MSKLRSWIETIDDLSVADHEVDGWPHPLDSNKNVVLAIKVPTLSRRNQLVKLFRRDEADPLSLDWDALAMGLLGEMVFDPDDMAHGPLFPTPADREMLLEKNGRIVWAIMDRCLIVGGFRNDDEEAAEQGVDPVGEMVDAGKES